VFIVQSIEEAFILVEGMLRDTWWW
jgi:hypothetical protein